MAGDRRVSLSWPALAGLKLAWRKGASARDLAARFRVDRREVEAVVAGLVRQREADPARFDAETEDLIVAEALRARSAIRALGLRTEPEEVDLVAGGDRAHVEKALAAGGFPAWTSTGDPRTALAVVGPLIWASPPSGSGATAPAEAARRNP